MTFKTVEFYVIVNGAVWVLENLFSLMLRRLVHVHYRVTRCPFSEDIHFRCTQPDICFTYQLPFHKWKWEALSHVSMAVYMSQNWDKFYLTASLSDDAGPLLHFGWLGLGPLEGRISRRFGQKGNFRRSFHQLFNT